MKKLTNTNGIVGGPHFAITHYNAGAHPAYPGECYVGTKQNGETEAVYPYTVVGASTVADVAGGDFPGPSIPVPQEVPKWAAEIALIDAGKIDAVEAVIAAITPIAQRRKVEVLWNKRPTINRNSQLIAALKGGVPLTDTEIDDLFRAAQALIPLYAQR